MALVRKPIAKSGKKAVVFKGSTVTQRTKLGWMGDPDPPPATKGKKPKTVPIKNGQPDYLSSTSLDREIVFGSLYTQEGMSGALRPPYDPDKLAELVEDNNALEPCIQAMITNVDGTGFEVVADEEATVPENTLDMLAGFFTEPWPGTSFLEMRKQLRRDFEVTGNAYVEVIRNLEGQIALMRRMDPYVTRIMRLGNDTYLEEVFSPTLNTTIQVQVRRRRFVQYIFGRLVYFKEFGAPLELNRLTGKWEDEGGGTAVAHTSDGTAQIDAPPMPPDRRANEVIHFKNIPHHILPYGIPRWINQTPSVLGSRRAEEFNLGFFDQGGIPPMLIIIQGGEAAETVEKAMKDLYYSPGPQKTTAAILQVATTSGEIDNPGNVKVTVERFGCYSDDTEVLTENGWSRFQDWDGAKVATVHLDSGRLEYQDPIGGLQVYDYDGEMVHFPGAAHDVLVTPNHKMVRENYYGHWERGERADKMEKRARVKVMCTPAYVEAPIANKFQVGYMSYPATEFLQFLGFFIADGTTTAYRDGREHAIRVTVKKDRKKEAFKPALKVIGACGGGMTTLDLDDEYVRYQIHDKSLRTWLRDQVGTESANKRIPREFLGLSTAQSQTLIMALFEGDAHHVNEGGRNSYTYSTVSRQLADDVQELSLRCGWRATIGNDGRGCFYVSVVPGKNFASLSCSKVKDTPFSERVAYSGKVYCFKVPNQTIVTRRNGRTAVHGNTDRQKDQLFQQFDANCEAKVRRSWRLPELFVGSIKEATYASALASYRVAESQVFKPERDRFDEKITSTLLYAIAGDKLRGKVKLRSLPISNRDLQQQLAALQIAVTYPGGPAITPKELIDNLNEVSGLAINAATSEERQSMAQEKMVNQTNLGGTVPRNIQSEGSGPVDDSYVGARNAGGIQTAIGKGDLTKVEGVAEGIANASSENGSAAKRELFDGTEFQRLNPHVRDKVGRSVGKRLFAFFPGHKTDVAAELAEVLIFSSKG